MNTKIAKAYDSFVDFDRHVDPFAFQLNRCAISPSYFFTKCLCAEPNIWQHQQLKTFYITPPDNRQVVGPRRIGATTVACIGALWTLLHRKGSIIMCINPNGGYKPREYFDMLYDVINRLPNVLQTKVAIRQAAVAKFATTDSDLRIERLVDEREVFAGRRFNTLICDQLAHYNSEGLRYAARASYSKPNFFSFATSSNVTDLTA